MEAYFANNIAEPVPEPFMYPLERAFDDSDECFAVFYAYGFGVNTDKPRCMGCLIIQKSSDGKMYKVISGEDRFKVVELVERPV